MRTIESGKYKGKTLQQCPPEYIVWASRHEENFAEGNKWVSRDAKFMLLMLEREQESAKAQAALTEGQVFDNELGWVTPSSDNALDVVRDSKWGYAIERIAKNRDMAQKRAEITDISKRGNLYNNRGFQLMR